MFHFEAWSISNRLASLKYLESIGEPYRTNEAPNETLSVAISGSRMSSFRASAMWYQSITQVSCSNESVLNLSFSWIRIWGSGAGLRCELQSRLAGPAHQYFTKVQKRIEKRSLPFAEKGSSLRSRSFFKQRARSVHRSPEKRRFFMCSFPYPSRIKLERSAKDQKTVTGNQDLAYTILACCRLTPYCMLIPSEVPLCEL